MCFILLNSGIKRPPGTEIRPLRGSYNCSLEFIYRKTNIQLNNWERVIPFFAFPAELRKIIYTTNTVESLNMSLRKVLKPRVVFPNEEAVGKVMYLALQRVIAKWRRPL